MLSGIVQALQSGGRWGDCPEHVYGPKKALYNRFVRWAERGVWEGIFNALAGAEGVLDRLFIDSTCIKAPLSPTSSAEGGMAAMQSLATRISCTLPGVIISTCGRPLVSHRAWTLVLRPPRVWPIPLARPPFRPASSTMLLRQRTARLAR